jgi:23S rRNA (guanosine2251-2'-O)-methyltransferase
VAQGFGPAVCGADVPDDSERTPYSATRLSAPYDAVRTLPACVILDNVRSAYNVGAFFRTADAVRAERLYLCGFTARPARQGAPASPGESKKVAKTALGSEASVRWEGRDDAIEVIRSLRERGYELAAVETSVRAVDLFDWRPSFPVCVVFGHEVDGLRPEVLDACDAHVRIPMLGAKHSLNVATAGGVVLYELLRKYRLRLES